MPVVLCFGDSNVWGSIPGGFKPETGLCERYEKSERWPGILQNVLGKEFEVIEESIGGRTTNLDEIIPGRPYKNGLALLLPSLETHYPIDVVVFMLGTNDTKPQYNRSTEEICEGMRELIQVVKTSNKGPLGKAPKILLIAPPPILKIPNLFSLVDDTSIQKSEEIPRKYKKLAKEEGCEFLDASLLVKASLIDGIHLDKKESIILGHAVAKLITHLI